jgi:predicted amino acid-binding ACT domain protein
MILQLAIPPQISIAHLKRGLKVAMDDVGVKVELQHHEIFRVTNEI